MILGKVLRPLRSGEEKLAFHREGIAEVPSTLEVTSPAFDDGGRIPVRYTARGENVSPPLRWDNVPPGAASIVLMVEDPDAPFPQPFVHAIACNLDPKATLAEGALPTKEEAVAGTGIVMGKNTPLKPLYTGMAPIPGHGPHHYHFQLFALDTPLQLVSAPGRSEVLEAMRGRVLTKGQIMGMDER